ncbi:MAG TPA: hypothetical protein VEU96_24220 [Bryobacteraceae bacterium]|nr:hypothetical protein [Bryobacteraceae bacterium]
MRGEAMARFMELRGWKVVQGAGSFWQEFRKHCYIGFPLHAAIDPNPDELDSLLRRTRALCLRYAAVQPHGFRGGLYLVRDKNFGFTSIQPKGRSKLRRGLERCEIRPVDVDVLRAEGMRLNVETMARQNRYEAEFGDPKRWKRFLEAVRLSPGAAVIGAFVDGRLNSYTILHREDRWAYMLYQMTLTSGLHHGANTALHYEVCRMIADPAIDAVCSGPVSMGESGLHDFKLQMGMTVMPQTFAFRFHPAVAQLATGSVVRALAGGLHRLRPRNARFEVLTNVLCGARLSNHPTNRPKEVVPC